jgi:hypothetical protein
VAEEQRGRGAHCRWQRGPLQVAEGPQRGRGAAWQEGHWQRGRGAPTWQRSARQRGRGTKLGLCTFEGRIIVGSRASEVRLAGRWQAQARARCFRAGRGGRSCAHPGPGPPLGHSVAPGPAPPASPRRRVAACRWRWYAPAAARPSAPFPRDGQVTTMVRVLQPGSPRHHEMQFLLSKS